MSNYFLLYYEILNQTKMIYVLVNMGNLANLATRECYFLMRAVFNNSVFIQNIKVQAFV